MAGDGGRWRAMTGEAAVSEMGRLKRCGWGQHSPLMIAYHDTEWGVPVRDSRLLFEHLVLDGFQAGLSWALILNKRDNFRRAFDGFDPARMARYDGRRIRRLLADPGIVRNRAKIEAAIGNARAFLALEDKGESFSEFLWGFLNGTPRVNRWRTLRQIPARTPQSDRMSAALKERGFRFVGSTVCYAFMQAAGMVNDHLVTCFRHTEVGKNRKE
ncbi:MAG TPA: DNA-3-methyladenine glycosylase I [Gemmatimonadales bacterium]|nr:DNA-3-methyladenine glycosylase I [Gemmatimonadales bacterium]